MRARWGVAIMVLLSGCAMNRPGSPSQRGTRRWARDVPPIRDITSVERIGRPDGSAVLFFHHTVSFDRSVQTLIEDLTEGGWQVLDAKGSVFYRAFAGCGPSCGDLRFYAVTRKVGPRSETMLRVVLPQDFNRNTVLPGACQPLELARTTLDSSSRYAPVFDVDLDRDGRLDVYVPREQADSVVWDAYVARGRCGHLVGTFARLPADPHMSELAPSGLVDLTVTSEVEDDSGRVRDVPVTFVFDGRTYVRREPPSAS